MWVEVCECVLGDVVGIGGYGGCGLYVGGLLVMVDMWLLLLMGVTLWCVLMDRCGDALHPVPVLHCPNY